MELFKNVKEFTMQMKFPQLIYHPLAMRTLKKLKTLPVKTMEGNTVVSYSSIPPMQLAVSGPGHHVYLGIVSDVSIAQPGPGGFT